MAVLSRKVELLQLMGRWAEAEAILRENLKMAHEWGTATTLVAALNALGWHLHREGYDGEAEEHCRKALTICREAGYDKGAAEALGYLGSVYYQQADYAAATGYFLEKIELCLILGDEQGLCAAYNNLGNILGEQGKHEESEDYYKKALEMARRQKNLLRECTMLGNLGIVCFEKKDYRQGMEYYRRTERMARDIGNVHDLGVVLGNMAIINLYQGRYDEAEKQVSEQLAMGERVNDRKAQSLAYNLRGNIHAARKDYGRAVEDQEKAVALGRAVGIKYYLSGFIFNLAQARFNCGDFNGARQASGEAQAINLEIGDNATATDCSILEARIKAREDKEAAIALLQGILEQKPGENQEADVNFFLHQLSGEEKYRQRAAELYRMIWETTGSVASREKLEQLVDK
jgi:tetratricopeptide (TPR) repeat protein